MDEGHPERKIGVPKGVRKTLNTRKRNILIMDMIESDEREGRLSASRMERTILCPGSWGRSRWIRELDDKDADQGQVMHSAIDTGDTSSIEGQQVDTVLTADKLSSDFGKESKSQHPSPLGILELYKEKRLWFEVLSDTKQKKVALFSGQLDRLELYLNEGVAIIADFKTLWGSHTEAKSNPQLAAQAVLVRHNYPEVHTIYAALIQPNVSPQVSSVVFNNDTLDVIEAKLIQVVNIGESFNAPIRPGLKQCKYCAALSMCQEAKAQFPDLISERLPTDTPNGMAAALEVGEMASMVHKANREMAKRLMEEEGWDIPGWITKPKAGRSTLDSPTIISRLRAMGVPDQVIWDKVGITKKNIDALISLYAKPSEGTKAIQKNRILDGAEEKGNPSIELKRA